MRRCRAKIALRYVLVASALALLGACGTTTVTVAGYRVPVSPWDGPWMAYRMSMPDGQTIEWIWGIEGFDEQYRWGTRYVLKLRQKRIFNAPTDAPSTAYELVRVVREEQVNPETTFQLPLRSYRDVYVRYDEKSSGHTLLDEAQIMMEDADMAPRLWVALSMYPDAIGTFSLSPDGRLRLRAIAGEFDPQMAMDSYIGLFGEPEGDAPLSWREEDYAERFTTYYADRFPGGV